MHVIRVAIATLVRDGALLTVRKKGARFFTQAGGKIEPGETPLAALTRELHEELGIILEPDQATFMGVYNAPAANETGHSIEAHNFLIDWPGVLTMNAEIEALEWLPIHGEPAIPVAALIHQTILPLLRLQK